MTQTKQPPENPGRFIVVMMYVRYPLSLRNVEDLLFERVLRDNQGENSATI
ncbi:hypothetical protein [Sphingopyxis granuli]|uniref:hypothetical protein n=1 Tax=Sphingopyxis granuli TaxID=267128 RepID=UPI001BAE6B95|nr:hypothetical protein [Sphingopyxis granuli]QUM74720.1 hypothetical protein ICN83_20835 [Sphingopyxis granuli]